MAFSLNPLDWFKQQQQSTSQQPYQSQPSAGSTLPYVGPYSPESYNAASTLAQGGQAAPYTSPIISAGQQILGKETDPNYNNTGGAAGSTGYDVNPIKAQVQDYLGRLNALYDSLNGAVDRNVSDKQSQLANDYNTQVSDATKSFGANQNQLGSAYAARGLGDSSYLSTAQQGATDSFNSDLGNLTRSRDDNYAKLGQFAATQKANFGAGRASLGNINLDQYGNDAASYNALNSLNSGLQGQEQSLQAQQAGLGTNADYQSQLNGITQAQQNTSAKLGQQLQTLLSSSASQFSKDQIAQGLIKSANLKDQNAQDYWTQYYSNLARQQQPAAVA